MQGERGAASAYAKEHGWTLAQLSIVLSVTEGQVWRYFSGYRRITPKAKTALLREYGDAAYTFVELCDTAWRVKHERTAVATKDESEAFVAPAYDGPYHTIDEWIRLFGKPGNGGLPDQNGRYSGFFPTEPCFIGD